MNPLYLRARATVDRAMRKYGQPIEIVVSTGAGEVRSKTRGAPFAYNVSDVDGTTIRQGDLQVMLSPVGVVDPINNGILYMGGVAHNIKSVEPFAPGGLITHYMVQVRK